MKRTSTTLLAILLSTGLLAQQTASPEALLKSAMQREQVDGDDAGALAQYKSLLDRFPDNRQIAAQTLLQVAGIYERMRRPDGLTTYQLIVAKYPDISAVAARARQRVEMLTIRTLKASETEIPVPPEAATFSYGGRISPDGRYLTFVDDSFVTMGVGNLGLLDLHTGTTRLVTRSKSWDEGAAREAVWSPDGQQLAYCWWNNIDKRYEVRTIARGGGAFRTVYRAPSDGLLRLFAWSPDARVLAVAIRETAGPSGRYRLALVSIAEGTLRSLKTFDTVSAPRNGTFSPDGRYLAFDWPPVEASPSRDVYVAAVDGSAVTTLVADPASNDVLFAWHPDGVHVLYAADHRGVREVRAIAVRNGQAMLDPVVLKRGLHGDGLGITSDGKLFVTRSVGGPDILIAPLDPLTGLSAGAPVALAPAENGVSRGQATWSPDGERIAYFRRIEGTESTLTVQTIRTGALRTYPAPLRDPERPVWQPDGRAVVFNGFGSKQSGQHRIALETEKIEHFSIGHSGGFSPDGQALFHPAPGTPGQLGTGTIMRRRLSDGVEDVVDRGRHRSMVLSPDGRFLALFDPGTPATGPVIAITPATGGDRRILVQGFKADAIDNEIAWTHDSRFVLFTTALPPEFAVWRVPVGGGTPEKIGIDVGWIKHMSVSPDGRHLALSVIGGQTEVWMWENLLPTRRQ